MSTKFDNQDVVSDAMKRYGWNTSDAVNETDDTMKNRQESFDFIKRFMAGEELIHISSPAEVATAVGKKAAEQIKNFVSEEKAGKEAKKRYEDFENSSKKESSFLLILTGGIVGLCLLIMIPFLLMEDLEEQNQAEGTSIVEVAKRELDDAANNVGGLKYKEWYGVNGNWCAMFVSYCANECGYIDEEIMPKQAAVRYMAKWYQDRGQWMSKESGYEPQPGDIIFFQNGMSHVGIVIEYDAENKMIYTIEGNTGSSNTNPYHAGSQVKEKHYPLTYKKISGYGLPNYTSSESIKPPLKEKEEIKYVPIRQE